jgi:small GTP-binding protein
MTADLKFVVVGDPGVGKTALLEVFTGKQFPTRYVPTDFALYIKEFKVDKAEYKLSLWDTGGHIEYDARRPLPCSGAQAAILCFAVDSKESFDNMQGRWMDELKHYSRFSRIVLIGTKADMRSEQGAHCVSAEDIKQFCLPLKITYVECSAKEDKDIEKIFLEAAKAGLAKEGGCCLLL